MWRWIRHWRDWAMSEIVTPRRLAGQPQALYFRSEKGGYYNVSFDNGGDPVNEYLQHYRLGVDGVFSDAADTALEARAKYLKEIGR